MNIIPIGGAVKHPLIARLVLTIIREKIVVVIILTLTIALEYNAPRAITG